MQASTASGRRARLMLLPVSWLIAIGAAMAALKIVAAAQQTTVESLLHSASLWLLVVLLPALILGKTLGLMGSNAIAYVTPLRKVFEAESRETGRRCFSAAMAHLGRIALGLGIATACGIVLYLKFGP